ncbi:MAG: acyloxyacyl hydrolase [Verrucomicrobiota bacterium]|jgi:opacity protein-like surface antigen
MRNSDLRQLLKAAWLAVFWANLQLGVAGDTGQEDPTSRRFSTEPLFERGRLEAAFNNGALFSPFLATRNRPTIDYTISELQVGYMLRDLKGPGWLRGNVELAGEGFGGGSFQSQGSYVAGATGWLRYNFVPRPGWRLIPYAQGGAGITWTDLDRRMAGQDFNFNLDLGVGFRYLISRHWCLNLEYRFQHISNANLNRRNIGLNANGPLLGVSYFF